MHQLSFDFAPRAVLPDIHTLQFGMLSAVAAALVALALLFGCSAPNQSPLRGQPAQVVHIVDGDTIDVTFAGARHRVRYILINTPETDQPFGTEATAANQALVGSKTVYLVKDVNETDRYDRLLRYVYLPDGTFVNAELVRQGFAQLAIYPPDVSKQKEIEAAEDEARVAGRGLWAAGPAAFGPSGAQATMNANVYEGPGSHYPVAGAVHAGQVLALTGQDAAGKWLQMANGLWLAAETVTGAPTNLPMVRKSMVADIPPVTIVAVDKRAEYVELRNDSTAPVDLAGWVLRSESGGQDCPLGGVLAPGTTLRVWAMTGNDGFSCGYGQQIWSNSGQDPAVLLAPGGVEVGRW